MIRILASVRRISMVVVSLLLSVQLAPSVALACEGGGEEGPNFAIQAEPTSVTKPKPVSTVTITDIKLLGEATVKKINVTEKEGSGQFSFGEYSTCVKTFKKYLETCSFKVTYLSETKEKITFVALDEHEAGSGTATITGTPPMYAEPSPVGFGGVKVNTETHKKVKIKANETVNLKAAKVTTPPYSITTDACSEKKLEASKECEIEIGFLPKAKESYPGKLEVPYELAATKETGTLTVLLTGEGT